MDIFCAEGVLTNPQAGSGRGEIASVVASASNAEGLGEASGAAGEAIKMVRGGQRESAGARHFFQTEKGFEGAEKNGTSFAFALTGGIETVVIAVDEINVGEAGRSEEHGIAGSVASGGVGSGIVDSKVGLDFNDAGGQTSFILANQNLAEKFASYAARSTSEERAIQRPEGKWSGFERRLFHARNILKVERWRVLRLK